MDRAGAAEQRFEVIERGRGEIAEGGETRGRRRSIALGPTPHMRSIGNGARKATRSLAGMTTRPSGLSKSLAIFAANLHEATPAEATRPSSARMMSLILRAIVAPSPKSEALP